MFQPSRFFSCFFLLYQGRYTAQFVNISRLSNLNKLGTGEGGQKCFINISRPVRSPKENETVERGKKPSLRKLKTFT